MADNAVLHDVSPTVGRRRTRGLGRAMRLAGGVLAVTLLTALFAAPAASAADRTVTVTPATGLKDGQTVTVSGTGFTPNTSLFVVECNTKATGAAGCDVQDVNAGTKTDANGAFTIKDFKVKEKFGDNDCTTSPCVVQAAEGPSPTAPRGTSAPLQFAAAAPTSTSAAPTTSAPPSATTQSAPPPTSTARGLAYTGTHTYIEVGLGLALIALGGLALWLTAARRVRHEH